MIPIQIVKDTASAKQEIILVSESQWSKEWSKFYEKKPTFFSAKKKEIQFISSSDKIEIICGVGEESNAGKLQSIGRDISHALRDKLDISPIRLKFMENWSLDQKIALLLGLYEGGYEYPFVGAHPLFEEGCTLAIDAKDDEIDIIKNQISALIPGKFLCMDWLNKPANLKTAPILTELIVSLSDQHGWKTKILDGMGCLQEGLGAYLSVNDASQYDAAFAIIEYNPKVASSTVGLVGKTITFDTGGISIKTDPTMYKMKSDMGGGTAVLGSLVSATLLDLPVRIIAILPITDNVVNNTATLPGDVITAYNGKTIEVQNTDAEGRLTLADGLSYLVKNYEVNYLIDLATLTGSVIRTFGSECAGIMSNSPSLQRDLIKAGDQIDEKLWPLPIWNEYDEEMKSDVADLKNIQTKPVAGAITAAKFVQHFIGDHKNWAHLDIAGTAFGKRAYATDDCATSYGVQLLTQWMQGLVKR